MDPNTRWYATLVLLSIAVVISIIWAFRTWQDAHGELVETGDTAEGLLGPLEEAYASGQMSEEEYLRIRSSVGKIAQPGKLSRFSLPPRPARGGAETATDPAPPVEPSDTHPSE